jgi:hypothetical protein
MNEDTVVLSVLFSILAAGYFGVGALFHWALVGDQLSISSAATLGVMIGWPILAGLAWLAVWGCFLLLVTVLAAVVSIAK